MAYVHLEDIGITGIAVAVPKNVINNRDLAEKFGEKHINKFIRTTGVIQRRIASEHQTASDLGLAAAQELLAKKGIDKSEIGALVFASHGPDYKRPATAYVFAKKIRSVGAVCLFCISLGCSAFVYGNAGIRQD